MNLQDPYSEIIELAQKTADNLKSEYANSPIEEFFAWLALGLQREALVSEAYKIDNVRRQVRSLNLPPHFEPEWIVRTINSAWAQEKAHKAYVDAVLAYITPPENAVTQKLRQTFKKIKGVIEGKVISTLLSKNPNKLNFISAKIAIVLGQKLNGNVPAFLNDLRSNGFTDFCFMNMALEKTAVTGYFRMFELIKIISDTENENFDHTTLDRDLAKIYCDEKYHYNVFKYFSTFPPTHFRPPDGPAPKGPRRGPSPAGPQGVRKMYFNDIEVIKNASYPNAFPIELWELKCDKKRIQEIEILEFIRTYLRDPSFKKAFDRLFRERKAATDRYGSPHSSQSELYIQWDSDDEFKRDTEFDTEPG